MAGCFPLSARLSQLLVAFIIEFDNEFERRMPHRTTRHGLTPGLPKPPWLVSRAMWTNFLQFIPEKGISARELPKIMGMNKVNLRQWLVRLSRWGYLEVRPGAIIRPTVAGSKAQAIWQPLTGVIEKRWDERFGKAEVKHLRESLAAVVSRLDAVWPDSLPILGYGLYSVVSASSQHTKSHRALPASLSKLLLAFATEFESESEVSLAISANVLRLVSENGVPVKDLPRLSGVSKEAVATSVSFLEKRGYASVEPGRLLYLNEKGHRARQLYFSLTQDIENRWRKSFGKDAIRRLDDSLEPFTIERLLKGLEPPPECWRASLPKPESLPHFPMILHRGGFPDGS